MIRRRFFAAVAALFGPVEKKPPVIVGKKTFILHSDGQWRTSKTMRLNVGDLTVSEFGGVLVPHRVTWVGDDGRSAELEAPPNARLVFTE